MPDPFHYIQSPVPSGINPAGRRRVNLFKNSVTGIGCIGSNRSLHQPCRGAHHLESGAGRCKLGGCIIIKGPGQIVQQLRIVLCIDAVCHHIVIISRIGHKRKDISRIYIRDHGRGGVRIQSQLRRSNIQPFDSFHNKIVGRHRPPLKLILFLVGKLHQPLFQQNVADLIAGDHILFDHKAVNTLGKA